MVRRPRFAATATTLTAAAIVLGLLAACAGTPTGADSAPGGTLRAVPGFDPASKTIRIGALFPVSGVFETTRQDIIAMEAYFKRATSPGGDLAGYTVTVENQDTQYNTTIAIPQYQRMKNQVVMFAGILGTPIIQALSAQLRTDKVVAIPAGFDASFVHNPNLVPIASPWQVYAANAVSYAVEKLGRQGATFCVLAQDDALGEAHRAGLEWAAGRHGVTVGRTVRFAFGTQDFTGQVSQLKSGNCQVVLLGGTGLAVQQAAVRAVQLNFQATWLGTAASYVVGIQNGPGAEYLKQNMYYVHAGGGWHDRSVPAQGMLLDDLAKYFPGSPPAFNTYQTGYAAAMATTAVLKKAIADSASLDRDALLKAAAALGTVDYQGFVGGRYEYGANPADRNPPRAATIFRVSTADPTGLDVVARDFTSEAARTFPIPAA